MLLVKAPSEIKLQINGTVLHLKQSVEWKNLENSAWFWILCSGELLSPLLHKACRSEKKSNGQHTSFTLSSVTPAIPSADYIFTGAGFTRRAEWCCWSKMSPTLSAHLVRKHVGYSSSHISPFASVFRVTARNPEELFLPPQTSLNLPPPTSSAQLAAEVNHALTSTGQNTATLCYWKFRVWKGNVEIIWTPHLVVTGFTLSFSRLLDLYHL